MVTNHKIFSSQKQLQFDLKRGKLSPFLSSKIKENEKVFYDLPTFNTDSNLSLWAMSQNSNPKWRAEGRTEPTGPYVLVGSMASGPYVREDLSKYIQQFKLMKRKTVAFEMGQSAIPGKVAATITSYLMSESDDIIVTESSSYGGVSAARGGLRALFCVSYQICLRRMRAVPVGWYGGVIHKIPCLQSLNTPIKLHAPDQSHRLFSLIWHQLEEDGKKKLDWRNK